MHFRDQHRGGPQRLCVALSQVERYPVVESRRSARSASKICRIRMSKYSERELPDISILGNIVGSRHTRIDNSAN